VTIRPLTAFHADDLKAIMPGYSARERYVITRSETTDLITFQLRLVTLPVPFVKHWDYHDQAMLDPYHACVKAGLSVGAFDGDQIVGIAICEAQLWNRSLNIWQFGVAPTHRQQGIGRALMNAAAERAIEQNLRVMVAETQNTNVAAIRFYRAVGFELHGLDLSYYTNNDLDKGEVALFMKRKCDDRLPL
jgi:ribosomal protein S18 acetylase RimI-like enzyme